MGRGIQIFKFLELCWRAGSVLDGELAAGGFKYLCICVFPVLSICVLVYVCICVFVYLCICIFVFVHLCSAV